MKVIIFTLNIAWFIFLIMGVDRPIVAMTEEITIEHVLDAVKKPFPKSERDLALAKIRTEIGEVSGDQLRKVLPLATYVNREIFPTDELIKMLKNDIPALPIQAFKIFDLIFAKKSFYTSINKILMGDIRKFSSRYIDQILFLGRDVTGYDLFYMFETFPFDFLDQIVREEDLVALYEIYKACGTYLLEKHIKEQKISIQSLCVIKNLTNGMSEKDRSTYIYIMNRNTLKNISADQAIVFNAILKDLNYINQRCIVESLELEDLTSLTIDAIPFFCALTQNVLFEVRLRILKNLLRHDFSHLKSVVLENIDFLTFLDKNFLAGEVFDKYKQLIKREVNLKKDLYLKSKQKVEDFLQYVQNNTTPFNDSKF